MAAHPEVNKKNIEALHETIKQLRAQVQDLEVRLIAAERQPAQLVAQVATATSTAQQALAMAASRQP